MDTTRFAPAPASAITYPIKALKDNHSPESQVTTSQYIEKIIGKHHYDYFLTVEENVINAIWARLLPTDRPIVLRGLQFSLPDHIILVIPENVELQYCDVICGEVHFYQGQLTAIAASAFVVGCGDKTIANADAPYSRSHANVPGAIANANAPYSQSNANARGSTANANVEQSSAYGNKKNALISKNHPGATVQSTVWGVIVLPYSPLTNSLKEQADQGDMEAAFQFGMLKIHEEHTGAEAPKIGLDYLEKAAETHSGAAYELGKLYLNGEKVAYNESLFVQYWILAHGLNHPEAAFELGMRYFKGDKVAQNDTNVMIYLNWAYNKKHPEAAFQCGELHLRSLFHKNPDEACRWHQIAAQEGHQQAQGRVKGYQAEHPPSVIWPIKNYDYPEDIEKLYRKGIATLCKINVCDAVISTGIVCLEIAADYPYPKASFKLGMLYFKGDKVPYNEVESLHYLSRAYEQFLEYEKDRHETAFQLGELYRHIADLRKIAQPALKQQWGTLITSEPDRLQISVEDANVKAQDWYQIAAQRGHAKAKKICQQSGNHSANLAQLVDGSLVTRTVLD